MDKNRENTDKYIKKTEGEILADTMRFYLKYPNTRAEVVTLMNRMLRRYPNKAYIDNNPVKEYVDLSTKHWAYYDIMEASITHDYGKEGKIETWKEIK